MSNLVLLGDSVFDAAAYTRCGPDVMRRCGILFFSAHAAILSESSIGQRYPLHLHV